MEENLWGLMKQAGHPSCHPTYINVKHWRQMQQY